MEELIIFDFFSKNKDSLVMLAKSKMTRHSLVYTLSNFLNKLIPFLLLPLLTRFLEPYEFGLVSLFGALTTILFPLMGLNLQGAYIRSFYDQSINNHAYRFQILILTILAFFVVFFVFWCSLSIFGFEILSDLPNNWLFGGCVFSLFFSIFQLQKAAWQIQQEVFRYAFFQNLKTLAEYTLIVIALLFSFGSSGVVYSRILVTAVFGLTASLTIFKSDFPFYRNFSKKKEYTLKALAFGFPLLPHAFSGVINSAGSRIIISQTIGPTETAFVSIALQFGGIISMLLSSVHLAFTPWFYKSMAVRSKAQDLKIVKTTYFLFLVAIGAALLLICSSPLILRVMTTSTYWQATELIPWFVIAFTLQGMYIFLSVYILFSGKTYLLSLITFSSSAIYLVTAWFAALHLGSQGVAICYTLLMLIKFFLTWFVASRLIKMPWSLKNDSGLEK